MKRAILNQTALLLIVLIVPLKSVHAKIIADCGAAAGKSYFLAPRPDGWVDDAISNGRLLFDLREGDKLNVLFKDASGDLIDAEKDGGGTFLVKHSEGFADFSAVTIYPATGVIETYSVTNQGNGARRLLWTSNKSRAGPAKITKVSAFVSKCDP